MVDVIGIHAELSSEEIGKSELDERVLTAMREVPRHLFVPAPVAAAAYEDIPLPIGFNKTISQPFMVALMTDLLDPQPDDRVLEVGTGLGYQTAILARLVAQICSVEIVEEFVESAQNRLKHVGIENVSIRVAMVRAGGLSTRRSTRLSWQRPRRKCRRRSSPSSRPAGGW